MTTLPRLRSPFRFFMTALDITDFDIADFDITDARPYVGRFAPSPSGPLHFGSLVAAAGSYLEARAHGGRWLLRIEDVDTPRTVRGAADGIITTLARFGFEWDGDIVWQSQRTAAYDAALERLKNDVMEIAAALRGAF